MKDPLKDSKDAARAAVLYDLLADRPRTQSEVVALTGWTVRRFSSAVQRLRDILAASGDTINVPAEPQGQREEWVYALTDGAGIIDAERSQWAPNRMKDAERRLKTIKHVFSAAVEATDGRTVEGRKARIYQLHLARAEEEIRILNGE